MYVETFIDVASNCIASPFTQTFWESATAQGITYPAMVATVTFAEPGTTFITFIFPDLIVTMLTPGELITQVSLPDLSVVSDVRAIVFSQDPEGQLSERAKYSRMSYIGLRLS